MATTNYKMVEAHTPSPSVDNSYLALSKNNLQASIASFDARNPTTEPRALRRAIDKENLCDLSEELTKRLMSIHAPALTFGAIPNKLLYRLNPDISLLPDSKMATAGILAPAFVAVKPVVARPPFNETSSRDRAATSDSSSSADSGLGKNIHRITSNSSTKPTTNHDYTFHQLGSLEALDVNKSDNPVIKDIRKLGPEAFLKGAAESLEDPDYDELDLEDWMDTGVHALARVNKNGKSIGIYILADSEAASISRLFETSSACRPNTIDKVRGFGGGCYTVARVADKLRDLGFGKRIDLSDIQGPVEVGPVREDWFERSKNTRIA